MTHWRTSRSDHGGMHRSGSHARAVTPRDQVNQFFPPGSLLAEPANSPLERSNLSQALLDALFLGSAALLIFSFAIGIGILGYVLFARLLG